MLSAESRKPLLVAGVRAFDHGDHLFGDVVAWSLVPFRSVDPPIAANYDGPFSFYEDVGKLCQGR